MRLRREVTGRLGEVRVQVMSDHYHVLLPTEEKWELVNHCLDQVLEMWTHLLETKHVYETKWKKGWPPTDCKVLRVHCIDTGSF
jgi:hypothetical protein